MPLEFQNIDVAFGALDTYTDPAEIPTGALTVAENVTSQVDGRYSKRYGYESQPDTNTTGSVRLGKRGSELVLFNATSILSMRQAVGGPGGTVSLDSWTNPFPVPHASVRQEYIALEQTKNFPTGTRATTGDLTMHAYLNSTTGGVHVYIFSNRIKAVVAATIDQTTTWDIVHVATVGTNLVVFYSSSTSQLIKFILFNTSTLTFGTTTTLFSAADVFAGTVSYPYAPFDICPVSSTEVYLVWATDIPSIRVARVNVTNGTVSNNALVAAEEPDGGIAVLATDGEFGTALWHSAGSAALRTRGFNPVTGSFLYAATTVEASGGLTCFNAGLCRISSTSHLAVWDRRQVAPLKGKVNWRTISNAGALGSQDHVDNVWLQTKPFTYGDFQYANVYAPYSTQETYFTIIVNYAFILPIAMHSYRTATGGARIACLAEIDSLGSGEFAFDSPIAYKFISNSSANAGIASYYLDFEDPRRFLGIEVGNNAFFASGVTFGYDGLHIFENNFLLYPEITDATPGSVASAGMDNGEYSYIVVFESSDINGNTDRSTTSLPVSVTTTAGAGLGKVTLTIDHLTITNNVYGTRDISASIFRTEANGSTYYCIGSQLVNPGTNNFTYVDQANDSTIIDNRIIYTQDGILDREPAPPSRQLVVHQNRVWGISAADPKMVFYSGDYLPGENPWFSALQQFRVDPGGDITAIAILDSKLLIFKSDRIFAVEGRGLQPTGTNSDLTPPRLITSDCGCIESRSVVVIPQGIMFQSSKGIYMLSRGEEISFIGQPVDAYLADFPVVTAATMMPTVREVRFDVNNTAGDEGLKLVYNYRDNRWTTHTNFDAADPNNSDARVDSIVIDNSYFTAPDSGVVYSETSTFRDPLDSLGGGPYYITSRLATGWIKLAGKQGLVRVQRINVLNEILEEHDLEVVISKDYVDVAVQTASLTAADITALPQEQISIHMQQQQGEAFKVELSDSQSDGSNSEGFFAKGLTFVAGVKRGSFEKVMQAGAKA